MLRIFGGGRRASHERDRDSLDSSPSPPVNAYSDEPISPPSSRSTANANPTQIRGYQVKKGSDFEVIGAWPDATFPSFIEEPTSYRDRSRQVARPGTVLPPQVLLTAPTPGGSERRPRSHDNYRPSDRTKSHERRRSHQARPLHHQRRRSRDSSDEGSTVPPSRTRPLSHSGLPVRPEGYSPDIREGRWDTEGMAADHYRAGGFVNPRNNHLTTHDYPHEYNPYATSPPAQQPPTPTHLTPEFERTGPGYQLPMPTPGSAYHTPGMPSTTPNPYYTPPTVPDISGLSLSPDASVMDEGPEYPGPLSNGLYGPYTKYVDIDYETGYWRGSVLVIQENVTGRADPQLTFRTINAPPNMPPSAPSAPYLIKPLLLDGNLVNHSAYRFDLKVPFTAYPQRLEYLINGSFTSPRTIPCYAMQLPARHAPLRWMFASCSGFSLGVDEEALGGFHPLWEDLLRRHEESPIHAMIGGGDQIYMDSMWDDVSLLQDWLKIKGRKNRTSMHFPEETAHVVTKYYFHAYLKHFAKRGLNKALASIPSINVIDDHDIWDGFGSYPEYLQTCPYFQGIGEIAKRMYLIFQQHETRELALTPAEGYFGSKGFNFLRRLGPHVTLLGTDTRWERSKEQIINERSYEMIFDRLQYLPPQVKHLIVVLAVPIVYPQLEAATQGLGKMSNLINSSGMTRSLVGALQKTGAFKQVVNQFGEPELLDDLVDHWSAKEHEIERKILVESLQRFAKDKGVRVTFLGGDVHCGGMGHFWSRDNAVGKARDHREMLQVVSSAIVNVPPPSFLISALHTDGNVRSLNTTTVQEMHNLFREDVDGKKTDLQKLMRRRNYCIVDEGADGTLEVGLRVENVDPKQDSRKYAISVLPLIQDSTV